MVDEPETAHIGFAVHAIATGTGAAVPPLGPWDQSNLLVVVDGLEPQTPSDLILRRHLASFCCAVDSSFFRLPVILSKHQDHTVFQ